MRTPDQINAKPFRGNAGGWLEEVVRECHLHTGAMWIHPEGEIARVKGIKPWEGDDFEIRVHYQLLRTANKPLADKLGRDTLEKAEAYLGKHGIKTEVPYVPHHLEGWLVELEYLHPDGSWRDKPMDFPFETSFEDWAKAGQIPYHPEQSQPLYRRLKSGEDTGSVLLGNVMMLGDGLHHEAGTGLVQRESHAVLKDRHAKAEAMTAAAEQAMRLMKRDTITLRLELEGKMARMKAEVEAMMAPLKECVAVMIAEVKRLYKIIHVIETYMGEREEVLQVKEGKDAPDEMPVYIFQRLLYADEEVGDPRRLGDSWVNGINHQNVRDEFPKWLLADACDPWYAWNYQRLCPTPKCVVAVKVSRQDRKYVSEDPLLNAELNDLDRMTFLVIRNGGNVYMVASDIDFHPRLFPKTGEIAEVMQRHGGQERVERLQASYGLKGVMLQGLIDRANIFALPEHVRLLDEDSHEGRIVFVRDEEGGLGDGKEPWTALRQRVNAKIVRGTRVVCTFTGGSKDFDSSRWGDRYYTEWNHPPAPGVGVYHVNTEKQWKRDEIASKVFNTEAEAKEAAAKMLEDYTAANAEGIGAGTIRNVKAHTNNRYAWLVVEELVEVHYILFDPGNSQWWPGDEEDKTRKRHRFVIYPTADREVLNVDDMTLEEVERMIRDRDVRSQYLRYMEMLWEVRDLKVKERKQEWDFIKLVILDRMLPPDATRTEQVRLEAVARDVVRWWKEKVIYTRPLTKDVNKAVRMIRAEVNRRLS